MEEKRVPLHPTSNLPTPSSRLPGLKRAIPVPSSTSKLPTAPTTKRGREEAPCAMLAAPIKRRKLSDDRNPPAPAVKKPMGARSTSGSSMRGGSKPPVAGVGATRGTAVKPRVTTAKNNNARTVTSSKPASAAAASKASAKAGGGKKGRPAWDLKGRLQDMEEQMKQLHGEFNNAQQKNEIGDQQIMALSSDKESLLQEHEGCKQIITDLRTSLSGRDGDIHRLQRGLADVEQDKSQLKRSLVSLEDDYSAAQSQIRGLKCSVAEMSAAQEQIRAHSDVLKMNLETAEAARKEKEATIVSRNARIDDLEKLVAAHEQKIMGFETERRVLHNTILELKGNIRVFCRVRPLLAAEAVACSEQIEHIGFPDGGKTLEVARLSDVGVNETLSANRKGSKFEFKYDRVFDPETTQATVFEEISQLVQSALDGYNVCIFAYGQTGSGKTYTMEGGNDDQSEGMIPRSVALIFQFVENLKDKGWQYSFEASFFEIYNETIRDLLGDGKDGVKHEVKMKAAKSDEVYVTNLTAVTVTHCAQVHKLLKKATENRVVAETKCNAHSSRSHSVFRMRIEGHNSQTDERCVGILNLIDLAGSERVKESGSEGARLKEATAINSSLSQLGMVIMALANKENHIPYRNSKLTHVLQNCLGGSSKVLMFVNVSPREDCVSETLNSLRFATKVNNCHVGTAQKKTK